MLGPHYSEGTNLSRDHPKTISLPEDDPDAMETIFNILHFRNDVVSDQLEPEDVLRLAIATDKYDLIRALQLSIRVWLECDSNQDPERLWQLARASYLLRNNRAFEVTTFGLLCHYGGSYFRQGEVDAIPFDEGRFAGMSSSHSHSRY